jgi:transposase
MTYKKYPKLRKQKAIELLVDGKFSVYRISKDLKIPVSTVQTWARDVRKKPLVRQNTLAKILKLR